MLALHAQILKAYRLAINFKESFQKLATVDGSWEVLRVIKNLFESKLYHSGHSLLGSWSPQFIHRPQKITSRRRWISETSLNLRSGELLPSQGHYAIARSSIVSDENLRRRDISEIDLVKSLQRVDVVLYISGAFRDVDIFKDEIKRLVIVWCRGEGLFSEH